MDRLRVMVRPSDRPDHQLARMRKAGRPSGNGGGGLATSATNRSFVACDNGAGGDDDDGSVVKLIKFAALLHPDSRHLVMHLERTEHDDDDKPLEEADRNEAGPAAQPFGATRPPRLPSTGNRGGGGDGIKVKTTDTRATTQAGSLGVDTERETINNKTLQDGASLSNGSASVAIGGGGDNKNLVSSLPTVPPVANRIAKRGGQIPEESIPKNPSQLDSNNNSNSDDHTKQQNMVKYHKISLNLQTVADTSLVASDEQQQQQTNHEQQHPGHEPFEIIWRDLCFEVDQISYDRLLVNALDKFKRLIHLGGQPRSIPSSPNADLDIKQQHHQQQVPSDAVAAAAAAVEKQQVGDFSFSVGDTNKQASRTRLDSLGSTGRRRCIFENLNGYVRSGEVSAILGPSGSGKTSLLNAIVGGRTDNYRGTIRLSGGGQRRMRMSIIPQKDYLIENLTVRENLLYSSRILNYQEAEFDHEANILRVVRMLNLTACFQASVANISGGEYKRVSIAQELLRQPDILILDEPTSGLDSLNCKKLVSSLVQLIEASRRGLINQIAIVMTIHQPDIDVFNMFDHVYCMARGGRVIYDGHPSGAMQTIGSINLMVARSSQIRGGGGGGAGQDGLLSFDTRKNDSDNNNKQQQQQQISCVSVGNPANLLIEIASEDIYGSEPVDRLARLQRKQFEQMFGPADEPPTPPGKRSQPGLDPCDNIVREAGHRQQGAVNGLEMVPRTSIELGDDTESRSSSSSSSAADEAAGRSSTTSSGSTRPAKHARASLVRDKRLSVRRRDQHRGRFWYHTGLLARRAFVSTLRDPLMTLISFLFHLSIPFVMWTVYPKEIGTVRVCPVINRELDLVSMASPRSTHLLEDLQEQLTTSFECSTMFFLTTYSFSMCSLAVAALAFPLNMHVLLKEVRNGWYNLPTFVLAKSLANFPFEVLFPVISLVLIYVMLDMPESYLEWRLCAIALVMVLVSMISTTLGLVFGAACMDSVQTAVFLAVASSLPQVILSGFTARIKNMPGFFQRASWLSPYRYSSDLINMIRFGFGLCPCDQATEDYLRTKPAEFGDVPAHLRPLFAYYLSNSAPEPTDSAEPPSTTAQPGASGLVAELAANNATVSNMFASNVSSAMGTMDTTTTTTTASIVTHGLIHDTANAGHIPGVNYDLLLSAGERSAMLARIGANEVDLFGEMAGMVSRAFSFGRQISNCQSFRSQLLTTAGTPSDDHLPMLFGCMFALLLATKVILFILVKYKIGSRI